MARRRPTREESGLSGPKIDVTDGAALPDDRPLAIVFARAGQLPPGAHETVEAAGGDVLVVGQGAEVAASQFSSSVRAWWADTGQGLGVGPLTRALAPRLERIPLLMLPISPDGRDLAPRLAAALHRPLLANASRVALERPAESDLGRTAGPLIRAELTRLDGRLTIPVEVAGPAVATYLSDVRRPTPDSGSSILHALAPPLANLSGGADEGPEVTVLEVLEPEPGTMDLADAGRILAGGAGLVPPDADQAAGYAIFELLGRVAKAMGASAGATRVASDSGWVAHAGSIGTTGIMVHPDLYVALGISGATQHVGGIGSPHHVVSVNLDPSSHMTAMANLGLVTDALALLLELADRFGVEVPKEVPRG
jgi:electron transfer flavoprotein alpha subunit